MTPAQAAAYIQSQVACAQIEALAMQAANLAHYCSNSKGSPPYTDKDFLALVEKYGIHHNAVHHYTHQIIS